MELLSLFLIMLNLVGLVGVGGVCSNGPYLYDQSCSTIKSQGIGSSMNRMKPSLLFASLLNATLIPNNVCFQSDEHDTDLSDFFGWGEGLDCTLQDMLSLNGSAAKDRLVHIEIEHGLPKTEKEWREHGSQKALHDKWLKFNGALRHACKHYGHGRIDKIAPEVFLSHHSQNQDSVFYLAYKAMEEAKHSSTKNVAYVLKQPFLLEGYECFADWLHHRWRFHGKGRDLDKAGTDKDAGVNSEGTIVVAFHLRHGDVATKDVNYVDPWKEVRSIPLKDGVEVLQSLRDNSLLRRAWAQGKVKVQFFSEGMREEFTSLLAVFPEAELHLGTNVTVEKDITALASADVLVASPSSFTSLAIALNHDGVSVIPKDSPEKFAGLRRLVSQEEVRAGNMKAFDKAFCKARLHLRFGRSVRDSVCPSLSASASGPDSGKRERDEKDPGSSSKYTDRAFATLAPTDYSSLHQELAELRGRVLPRMSAAEVVGLLGKDSKIRGLFPSSVSDRITANPKDGEVGKVGTCGRSPDRQAFSMPEYQPTVCSRKPRTSALSVPFAYVVRTVAQAVVDNGFQPSVYIVHGGDKTRRERISGHLIQAGVDIKRVHWETGYVAGNLTEEEKAVFVTSRAGSARCTDMMNGMDRACKYGYQFSPSERSVALKHMSIFEDVAAAAARGPAPSLFEEYALVLEDDQFVPRDVRRQLVEIVLQAPLELGFVMLDDSFFFVPAYNPPRERENFVFAGSYERPEGRTMGAYLMSHKAASAVVQGSYLKPMYAPCDHQLGYAIRKAAIITHWAWPPVTCAGSQGLETYYTKSTTGGINMDSGDRLNCLTCCDRFVNATSMRHIYDFV